MTGPSLSRQLCSAYPKNSANYAPLSPISFLERSETVFADTTAVIHGDTRRTYAELGQRTRKLASALRQHGVKRGDSVSVVLTNTPHMLEAHYGVICWPKG
eukprot:1337780-Amorphochlora_amoeboformis.AAC.1